MPAFNRTIRHALLIVFIFSIVFAVSPAYAASIMVTSNTDDGSGGCTLREAIESANTNTSVGGCTAGVAGPDAITFAGNYTITLAANLPNIQTEITIDGSGQTIIIDGAATYRGFFVDPTGNLNLNEITVQNAISAFGGGAIYNSDGVVTVTNSTFLNNTAVVGGGLYNSEGEMTLTDSTVSGNSANVTGGIHNSFGTVTLDNVEVTGNTGTGRAGGIYNYYGTLIIKNGSLIGKSGAPNTSCTGGGIFAEGVGAAAVLVDASTISYNVSLNCPGGGIYLNGGVDLTIRNGSIIDNNTAGDDTDLNTGFHHGGGGIYATAGPTITITDSTLSNNSAICITIDTIACGGGGLRGGSTVYITNSTLVGNTTTEDGGGINLAGNAAITNSTFSGNDAANGGGIYNDGTINRIINSTFSGNSATTGGGISNVDTITSIVNTIFSGNTGGGGGDCSGTIPATSNSFDSDGTCGGATQDTVANIGLGALADNGGATETMAPKWDSVVLGVGDLATCAGAAGGHDQRGVTRPADACDSGAFERDTAGPQVLSNNLVASYINSGPSTFSVVFNVNLNNLGGGSDPDDAENPANYLVLEEGSTAGFQTTACSATDFVNDTQITVDSVSYDSSAYTSTLIINSNTALPTGTYRLFVCGTTSITDPANQSLNGGDSDTIFDFVVGVTGDLTSGGASATVLPETGFAPATVTQLDAQPAELAYASTDIVLSIPKLGVTQSIVGVPQNVDGWNVSWLGNGVGYLSGTAFPTWAGNTALTGHVWNADGSEGVFYGLDQLQHGDRFMIEAWGLTYTYEVRDSEQVYAHNLSALDHSDYDVVTLITCEGYSAWSESYGYRRVVTAVLVDVE